MMKTQSKGVQSKAAAIKAEKKPVANGAKTAKVIKSHTKATKATAPPARLTKTGQHTIVGDGCIATSVAGKPCLALRVESHIPYCKSCMATGDPSLKVVPHPKFGKCLIARRKLVKGYTVAWWGRRIGKTRLPDKNWEWALESTKGVIDAVPFRKGSQLQFTQCPGPTEKPTINDCDYSYDKLLVQKPKTCLIFRTLCDIPKMHQFTMMYNKDEKTTEEFFAERNLVRQDVGCKAYPALKKDAKKTK